MLRFLKNLFRRRKKTITVFPKGTIVKYKGIPCELLQDTPYYSETFRPKSY